MYIYIYMHGSRINYILSVVFKLDGQLGSLPVVASTCSRKPGIQATSQPCWLLSPGTRSCQGSLSLFRRCTNVARNSMRLAALLLLLLLLLLSLLLSMLAVLAVLLVLLTACRPLGHHAPVADQLGVLEARDVEIEVLLARERNLAARETDIYIYIFIYLFARKYIWLYIYIYIHM